MEAEDDLALGSLINRNFELRRRIFGDAALGKTNLAMIKCAWSVNGTPLLPRAASGLILCLARDSGPLPAHDRSPHTALCKAL